MATYVIGDVQGCYQQLLHLLETIQFEPKKDKLWFTGDLVNRGPHSLKTLRLLFHLEDSVRVVLGNHDLHLLAIAYGCNTPNPGDTLDKILEAKDKHDLIDWLLSLPLFYFNSLQECALTRMRFCTVSGHLDMSVKGNLECETEDKVAWFHHPNRKAQKEKIIFGHWAALEAKTGLDKVIAVDAGCVWGGSLMAYCLETQVRHTVPGYKYPG